MTKDMNTLIDELHQEDIITLISADGEEISFVQIAGIALESGFYTILKPAQDLEGMEEDEALVFRVEPEEDGEDHFRIEMDEEIIDAVFNKYYQLLEEMEAEEE